MMARGGGRGKIVSGRVREELQRRSRRTLSLVIFLACVAFANEVYAQVTFERLVNSAKEPQNWMTYSGDYSGKRFSALDQINAANAHSLQAKWVYQTAGAGRLETTPRGVGGFL